jgi:hypothetical protein
MEKDQVLANREKAVQALKRQTGLDVGGPTNMCQLFAAHVVTGNEPEYAVYPKKLWHDEAVWATGLHQHDVTIFNPDKFGTLRQLLEGNQSMIDAVLISEEIYNQGHQIAVVPTTTDVDGQSVREYHVVDSLAKDGLVTYVTPDEAIQHATALFEPERVGIFIKPTDEEIARRSQPWESVEVMEFVEVADGAFVKIPMDPTDPRFEHLQAYPDSERVGTDAVDFEEYDDGEGTLVVQSERFRAWEDGIATPAVQAERTVEETEPGIFTVGQSEEHDRSDETQTSITFVGSNGHEADVFTWPDREQAQDDRSDDRDR